MYSCVNYARGCRGRSNVNGGRCADCRSLNLRKPAAAPRAFAAAPRPFRAAEIDMTALLLQPASRD
ncbi:MAG: hypothetical protein M1829_003377 [Trizodia sp. TS-e1964]|nr:MAG: hypothetical protein M1829_003377 [Trizodia sp. TS-e1964]